MNRSDTLKILKDFKENNAQKYGIILMGVFGSVARDQATDKSDVDIFLTTKTPDAFNIVHIEEALEELLKRHVDIVRLRDKMNPALKSRIEKDAVYV